MATTKEVRIEVSPSGVECAVEETRFKGRCVGLAPTRNFTTDEEMLEHYKLSGLCALATRQLKQDAKNAVRAKYQRDQVSATTIINAQASGEMTPEMIAAAKADYDAGKYEHNWTRCCAVQLGLGDDALAKADPRHIHWDCIK
jgi:hypothetical protein